MRDPSSEMFFHVLLSCVLFDFKLAKCESSDKNSMSPSSSSRVTSSPYIGRIINYTNGDGSAPMIPGCESNKEWLDCLSEFIPKAGKGIPTTRGETENACRVFMSSMNCTQERVRKCNHDPISVAKFNATVGPTIAMYKKICKDQRTMAAFYRYGDCYKKVTPGYMKCSDWYEQVRDGLTYDKSSFKICCYQINFLTCVSKVARHLCKGEAYHAIINLAEQAVQLERTRGEREKKAKNEPKMECVMANIRKCPDFQRLSASGSGSPSHSFHFFNFMIYLKLHLFFRIPNPVCY